MESEVTSPFFYLCLHFGSEVVVRLMLSLSPACLLPVSSLPVAAVMVEAGAAVDRGPNGNKQTRPPLALGGMLSTRWQLIRETRRMDFGLNFAGKTFAIRHGNAKFAKLFLPLHGSLGFYYTGTVHK